MSSLAIQAASVNSDISTVAVDVHFLWVEVADSYFCHFPPKEWVAPILLSPDRKSSIDVYVGKTIALPPMLIELFKWFRSSCIDGATCMLVAGNPA